TGYVRLTSAATTPFAAIWSASRLAAAAITANRSGFGSVTTLRSGADSTTVSGAMLAAALTLSCEQPVMVANIATANSEPTSRQPTSWELVFMDSPPGLQPD